MSRDWYRCGVGEYPNPSASFTVMKKKDANAAIVVPHIEAGSSIKEMITIDGLRICLMRGADIMLKNLAKALLIDIRGVLA